MAKKARPTVFAIEYTLSMACNPHRHAIAKTHWRFASKCVSEPKCSASNRITSPPKMATSLYLCFDRILSLLLWTSSSEMGHLDVGEAPDLYTDNVIPCPSNNPNWTCAWFHCTLFSNALVDHAGKTPTSTLYLQTFEISMMFEPHK